jgi:hypothetical protein
MESRQLLHNPSFFGLYAGQNVELMHSPQSGYVNDVVECAESGTTPNPAQHRMNPPNPIGEKQQWEINVHARYSSCIYQLILPILELPLKLGFHC